MLKRSEPVLRILCLGLAALVLFQLASVAARKDPLAGVRVPRAAAASPAAVPGPSKRTTNDPPAQESGAVKTNLPPLVQARVTRITESEILGPLVRPPMIQVSLLGIAGRDAFVRTPNGKTELLRVGEENGGIKLVQIGTNRVVIEQDGHRKELTMFSGFGSEPLLPKGKENPQ